MTTVDEIEAAIERLSIAERELLESRLLSRRFGLDSLDAAQREELLRSLDSSERDIDQGWGLTADLLRESVRAWACR
jgi:hypothetical protein